MFLFFQEKWYYVPGGTTTKTPLTSMFTGFFTLIVEQIVEQNLPLNCLTFIFY